MDTGRRKKRAPRARPSAGGSRATAPIGAPTPALSHVVLDADHAHAAMVDVGAKPVRARTAVARARVRFPEGLYARVLAGGSAKGSSAAVREVARSAGILAAKRTGELVPMCHPLGLDLVAIDFTEPEPDVLEVRCTAACRGRTGVEMEALVGAAIAALTVYDMTKSLDPAIAIERVELLEKRGGKSGPWKRAETPSRTKDGDRRGRRR